MRRSGPETVAIGHLLFDASVIVTRAVLPEVS
jgi:hypothetical protein